MMKPIRQILIIAAGILLLLGIPFLCTDTGKARLCGGDAADAVSSATIPMDAPSGEYVILIHEDTFANREKEEKWAAFFRGEDVIDVFDDISVSVADGDATALALAESYSSKLGANQVRIYSEDVTMLTSRADAGKFTIIMMSAEYAEHYHLETAYNERTNVIYVKSMQ